MTTRSGDKLHFDAGVNDLDRRLTRWMARHSVTLLRISLGVIFVWFGLLKFIPNLSPAEDLATRTIAVLTFGLVTPKVAVAILATWECCIGLGLLFGVLLRAVLLLMFVQMAGTVAPLFLFPNEVFLYFPYAPTLEGQYIIKNLVLISAGFVIGATVRGGKLVADPEVVRAGATTTALCDSPATP